MSINTIFATDLRELKEDVRDAIRAFRKDSEGDVRKAQVAAITEACTRLGEASGLESPSHYASQCAMLCWAHSNPQRVLTMVDCIGDYYPRLWLRILILPIVLSIRLAAWLVKQVR